MSNRVLITGGTGFLGRRLALALKAKSNVVAITGRNNKQNAYAQEFTGCQAFPMDVARQESVYDTFREFRPEIVIHAAATKFVDLAERQPLECVDVNVVGSQNVARASIETGVKTVIGVSTDKAAPPVRNTYGMTKALMERVFCALDGKTPTRFACARYGNVAWSTGSVLPVWKKMHAASHVIRTTGPDMTRFFFTVDEAVQLILTALDNMDSLHGAVLSRTMKSALIRDMLDVWVSNLGGRWERMEGRPGERADEFLIGELELPFTREVRFEGIRHYVITFNQRCESQLPEVVSSATAERLTKQEVLDLLCHPPEEER